MRVLVFAFFAALAACASTGATRLGEDANPFPVARGSALPPPELSRSGQTAPPEGAGAGGLEFGQWRGADPAT